MPAAFHDAFETAHGRSNSRVEPLSASRFSVSDLAQDHLHHLRRLFDDRNTPFQGFFTEERLGLSRTLTY